MQENSKAHLADMQYVYICRAVTTVCGYIRRTAAWTDLQVGGAMAVVGIHKALLQLTHLGALLSHYLLTLLHRCLQSLLLHAQGLLQLCSPGPLLIHLALEALVLILSLLYTSHSQSMSTLSTSQWTTCVTMSARLLACTDVVALLCHMVAIQVTPWYPYWHEH